MHSFQFLHSVTCDYGAILFCTLTDEYNPMPRIILSRDGRRIDNLPFGSVPLIRVTPIAESEIEHLDQSDEGASSLARHVLAERQIETLFWSNNR